MSWSRSAAIVLLVCIAVTSGLALRSSITVAPDTKVYVSRAADDGLAELATTELSFAPPEAFAGCSSFDVKDVCCPAGCAAKKGPTWAKADEIFRGCMRGLGCGETDVKNASVFMKCDCEKK